MAPVDKGYTLLVIAYGVNSLRATTNRTILLASLYCFMASAYAMAFYYLQRDGLRSKVNRWNLAAVTIMFSLTTYYTIFALLELWDKFDQIRNTAATGNLAVDLVTIYDIGLIDSNFGGHRQMLVFAGNVVFGDLIILWRALMIWAWNKRIVAASGALLLASVGLWLYIGFTEKTRLLIVSEALSLAISLCATALIFAKAWQRRRMIMKQVVIVSRRSALENVFAILTESGIIYTVLWIIYLDATYYSSPHTDFSQAMTIIMIVVTPLYPTAIVILVAMHKTPLSDQLTSIVPLTIMDPEQRILLSESPREESPGEESPREEL